MARTGTTTELQPIDRLEDKVRQLVALVDSLRNERARAADDVLRLQRELDGARARLGESAQATADMAALREEREAIRTRVGQMIAQIDKLNL